MRYGSPVATGFLLLATAWLAFTTPVAAHAQRPAADTGGTTAMRGMMVVTAGVPAGRASSGTSWTPDAVTEPMHDFSAGKWDLMLHGFAFAQYDHQDGARGDTQFGVVNWAMLMATHDFAGGRLQLRSMLSLDRIGVGASGYPELMQTGESFH